MKDVRMLSLVIPCYNEAEVLAHAYAEIIRASAGWEQPFEMILIDDGSRDATWEIITQLCESDPRVRGLQLSRNFGQAAALGAGMEAARGDAVVILDADLQDPPNVVTEMVQRWKEGYDVVAAKRRNREKETAFKLLTAFCFYRTLAAISPIPLAKDTGEFCLLDARVVKELLAMPEHSPYWRGLRTWTGFKQTSVMFDRPGRAMGETKYTLKKLLGVASDGFMSFSALPMRLGIYVGLTTMAAVVLGALIAAGYQAATSGSLATVPWLALAGFFLGGVQLACLGIVGEGLNRVLAEVRNRPRWIVSQHVGATQEGAASQSAGSIRAGNIQVPAPHFQAFPAAQRKAG